MRSFYNKTFENKGQKKQKKSATFTFLIKYNKIMAKNTTCLSAITFTGFRPIVHVTYMMVFSVGTRYCEKR